MLTHIVEKQAGASYVPLAVFTADDFAAWLADQSSVVQRWVAVNDFAAKPGSLLVVPDDAGDCAQVLCGLDVETRIWSLAKIVLRLPAGDYEVIDFSGKLDLSLAALGWGLSGYRFDQYKQDRETAEQVVTLAVENAEMLNTLTRAIALVRDLINTPTEEMGPAALSEALYEVSQSGEAQFSEIVGEALLDLGYPAVHAVSRASHRPGRLIDVRWGDASHPRVTLVGKGVCFDTGGLNLKPGKSMTLMKKDMGGAAHVIGLAQLIMDLSLPIQLRVLVPAVENAVSGNAYRPGDIVETRSGLSIEVGNTDAEGRVILADALTEAVSESPDLVIDFATLTGAARVAVGTDVPAFFTNDEQLAVDLMAQSTRFDDPIWRLPLYQPYKRFIDTPFADIRNDASTGFGGAITAALFLERFVGKDVRWLHFDLMAWNSSSLPGRPEGGEAMGLRAVLGYLIDQYA